jgi:hypothetical protein
MPLPDLIRRQLTSFSARDEAHLNDLDQAGLITADVEDGLSAVLRERLARVRARCGADPLVRAGRSRPAC